MGRFGRGRVVLLVLPLVLVLPPRPALAPLALLLLLLPTELLLLLVYRCWLAKSSCLRARAAAVGHRAATFITARRQLTTREEAEKDTRDGAEQLEQMERCAATANESSLAPVSALSKHTFARGVDSSRCKVHSAGQQ